MAKIKKIVENIKDHRKTLEEHSSNIITHGKEIWAKGKSLVESEEGMAIKDFIKAKFSKENRNKKSNISINDVLVIGNKVKDIVDNDITKIAENVQGIKNTFEEQTAEQIEMDNTTDFIENKSSSSDIKSEPIKDEDNFFEDSLSKLYEATQNGLLNLDNPEEVLNALNTLKIVANETIMYVAEQETKQVEINAQKEIIIEKIKVIGDAIKIYLDKTFDDRSSIFAKQFQCVDEALKSNNTELLAVTLNSINALAAQSPFKALTDIKDVQQKLLDNQTEWDI